VTIPIKDVSERLTTAPKSVAKLEDNDKGGPRILRGGPRKGMGDIPLDEGTLADMQRVPESTAAQHLVQGPDGSWAFTPERQAFHDSIIEEALQGKTAPEGKPQFNVLGGGPAAGKSTMVRQAGIPALTDDSAVMVNADEMKDKLPEYREMLDAGDPKAAALSHEESSYLAKRLQAASFENGYNVRLDGTGDSTTKSMMKKIKAGKDAGYAVNGYYTTVPTDVAVERAIIRGNKIGRHVPEEVIRDTHISVSKVLPELHDQFDEVRLYDTSSADIKPLMESVGGKQRILDQDGWDTFVAKGREDAYRKLADVNPNAPKMIVRAPSAPSAAPAPVPAPVPGPLVPAGTV